MFQKNGLTQYRSQGAHVRFDAVSGVDADLAFWRGGCTVGIAHNAGVAGSLRWANVAIHMARASSTAKPE